MFKRYKFDTQKFKLGMRTFKIRSSCIFSHFIVSSFKMGWYSDCAFLSAVFSLREDFGKSVHFGFESLVNSIGGFYALLYFILNDLFSHNFWVTLIFIPIFTMLTIMTNVSFNNAPGVISGVATMLIIALSVPAGDSIFYALQRVFETFVGVFISVIVNYDVNLIKNRFYKE